MITCQISGEKNAKEIIRINEVPTHCNILLNSYQEAVAVQKGDITLCYSPSTGHVFNRTFNREIMEYTVTYDNALDYSRRFQEFADHLAKYLVETYDLHDKTVLEIGCGKGEFLKRICKLGNNRGIGFDESYQPLKDLDNVDSDSDITFISEFYSEQYANLEPDIIICRHVLEHIENPVHFLSQIREINKGRKFDVYFEVPNVMYTLKSLGIWDLIYEHCHYFSQYSLNVLFNQCGFSVFKMNNWYENQFIGLEAGCNGDKDDVVASENLSEIGSYVTKFKDLYSQKVLNFKEKITALKKANKSVVVWGTGSKGITFANVVAQGGEIDYFIDINPNKQGKFVSGKGQEIKSPEFLKEFAPDYVIIMNQIYENEIRKTLESYNLKSELVIA